jgi:hypothetical protein
MNSLTTLLLFLLLLSLFTFTLLFNSTAKHSGSHLLHLLVLLIPNCAVKVLELSFILLF